MTMDGHRKLRLFFKFGLLASLPVAGYLWALTSVSPGTIPLAIGVTALGVAMALGAEIFASAGESRLSRLRAEDAEAARKFQAESQSRDERLRQMDRIVETLSNQNHDLRGKLVSIHGEVHRLTEETSHLEAAATPAETTAEKQPEEEAGADVTDINSVRRR